MKHLINTLNGLARGSMLPDEIILIEMDSRKSQLEETGLEIKHKLLEVKNKNYLPIAEARNFGVYNSKFNKLAFLDVDCIPSESYIESLFKFNFHDDELYMGLPKYLFSEVENFNQEELDAKSIIHPHRPEHNKVKIIEDYGMFWSLTFFLTYDTFKKIGGFDNYYKGYGAEDTDFAFKARELNIGFILTPFTVYHQQHSFCRPPLNSMKSIVRNCNYFYKKWQIWPMANHLEEFAKRSLILWDENYTKPIKILRQPTIKSIEQVTVLDEPFS
nr:glycosyltransferase family A protein [Salegentibacter echinorum]